METLTEEEVHSMRVVDLKDALSARGLNNKGIKAELLERLLEHISSSSSSEAGAAGSETNSSNNHEEDNMISQTQHDQQDLKQPEHAKHEETMAEDSSSAGAEAEVEHVRSNHDNTHNGDHQQALNQDQNGSKSNATAAEQMEIVKEDNQTINQEHNQEQIHDQNLPSVMDINENNGGSESRKESGTDDYERDRSKSKDRERERHKKEKDRDRDRDSDRERERDRDHKRKDDRERHRDRDREKDRDRDRDRERDRHREHDRDKHSDRDRPRERDGDKDKDRDSRRSKLARPKRERKEPSLYWDKAPPGFEHLTPLQYKALLVAQQLGQGSAASNVASVQAAPKAQVPSHVHPSRAGLIGAGLQPLQQDPYHLVRAPNMNPNNPNSTPLFGMQSSNSSNPVAKQSKRLYVGNIPARTPETIVVDFFNNEMLMHNLALSPGNPVVGAQVASEKNYSFVEFRTPEEATRGMALDGVNFNGLICRIKRPKDFVLAPGEVEPQSVFLENLALTGGAAPAQTAACIPGTNIISMVTDSPHKIFLGNIPLYLDEKQIIEIVSEFGELRAFNLVKDPVAGSKGYAFMEFADPRLTELAIQGLNGMVLGDKAIVVQLASLGSRRPGTNLPGTGANAMSLGVTGEVSINDATEVLQLLNMVMPEELVDPEEYNDILDDVREECRRFGDVLSVKIPRPIPGQDVPGVGKVYVEFSTKEQCFNALQALSGRKFANRIVISAFYDPELYHESKF